MFERKSDTIYCQGSQPSELSNNRWMSRYDSKPILPNPMPLTILMCPLVPIWALINYLEEGEQP